MRRWLWLAVCCAACGPTLPPQPPQPTAAEQTRAQIDRTIALIRDYCATQPDVNACQLACINAAFSEATPGPDAAA